MNHNRLIAALALLIFAILATSVQAQSGRRSSKPPPAAPVPTPTPEPTPAAKKPEKEAELVFLVATDRSTNNWVPLSYYSAAQQGCADRLRTRSSVDVDVAERDMTRGEAIQKAKSQTKTYVVLLGIQQDTMSRSYDELEVDFVLLEPATAKVVLTGRSYLNGQRTGPVVINPTGRSPMYREPFFKQAGADIADRILKKMHMGK